MHYTLTCRKAEVQYQSSPSAYTRVDRLYEDIDDEYDDMSLQLDLIEHSVKKIHV